MYADWHSMIRPPQVHIIEVNSTLEEVNWEVVDTCACYAVSVAADMLMCAIMGVDKYSLRDIYSLSI